MLAIENSHRRRKRVGKVIPEKSSDEEVVGWTVRTTKGLLKWIDAQVAKNPKYTRNEVAVRMLEFAKAEEEASSKGGKR